MEVRRGLQEGDNIFRAVELKIQELTLRVGINSEQNLRQGESVCIYQQVQNLKHPQSVTTVVVSQKGTP